jgi:ribose/xylose/arabinose/galactoside ABC-type transport system permease subunit
MLSGIVMIGRVTSDQPLAGYAMELDAVGTVLIVEAQVYLVEWEPFEG